MKTNIQDLKEAARDARRAAESKREETMEQLQQLEGYLRILNATEELLSEIGGLKDESERRQTEIDDLSEQLEQKQAEIDHLHRQLLEAENQQLEVKAHAKPLEIHNYFEAGSSSQVFNDKVTSKFARQQKKDKKKKEQKKWKRIIRKVS